MQHHLPVPFFHGSPPLEPSEKRDLHSCALMLDWKLSDELALKVANVMQTWDEEAGGIGIRVISGYRTRTEQQVLIDEGRTTLPWERSTHGTCPATGADLWIDGLPTTAMKHRFARIVFESGLRVGGGSPIDPDTLLHTDWNHVDLGPRG